VKIGEMANTIEANFPNSRWRMPPFWITSLCHLYNRKCVVSEHPHPFDEKWPNGREMTATSRHSTLADAILLEI